MITQMTDHLTTKTTYVVAAGAVSSPWWLEWLRDGSEMAALLAPILAVIWLAVQIGAKLWQIFGKTEA